MNNNKFYFVEYEIQLPGGRAKITNASFVTRKTPEDLEAAINATIPRAKARLVVSVEITKEQYNKKLDEALDSGRKIEERLVKTGAQDQVHNPPLIYSANHVSNFNKMYQAALEYIVPKEERMSKRVPKYYHRAKDL